MRGIVIITLLLFFAIFNMIHKLFAEEKHPPYTIPVLVVNFFPVEGHQINIKVTGDWGESLQYTREKTDQLTKRIIAALELGSCFHRYKYSNSYPSLQYKVVGTLEFLNPLPAWAKPGFKVPFTDYNRIMADINIKHWVEDLDVKEVWIWGYHGNKIGLWESNMSGPYGDISNSDRDANDLPILSKTYTVYHYNYQRGASEAIEDHMHQIEAVLRRVDNDLFWTKFVGQSKEGRCGWAHYPPNADRDYDWANHSYVWTDIEDWKPEGGPKKKVNCDRWECDSLKWFIYWMQNLPGEGNDITYRGWPLRNWWIFIGDFDYAMKNKLALYQAE